ncbi:MAG: serine/threonine protein kinase [Planctomycetaceae bacterium]|nr:serine/threonine protein kinase [Planctomycetaceae bacterium]
MVTTLTEELGPTRGLFMRRLPLLSTLILAVLLAAPAPGEDWNQFRGPNATGVSRESKNLPVKFSTTENVVWKKTLGTGVACPIISGGRCIETATVGPKGKQQFVVFGFDAATGRELWKTAFPAGTLPSITWPNQHASCTPTSDGERVYVHYSTIGLICLDATNGKHLWTHKTSMPFYLLGWGAANSPILHEDKVIFCLDDDLASYILALDKYTGKPKWTTKRPEMLGGYAVPVVVTSGKQTDIVMAGSGKLKGYDPGSGKVRWSCHSLLRTIMTTPAVVGDKIYVSVQSYGDTDRTLKFALLQWRDTNQDEKLDKTELGKAFWEKFDKGDANKDGFLTGDEIDDAFQAKTNRVGGGNIIQMIRGGGTGDVTKTHLEWNLNTKAPSNIASPLVVNDQLFVVKEGGISAAFSATDGKTHWPRRRIRNLGHYYASPVYGDGKIYVTGENGFIVVLQQGPKLKFLAKNDVGESCVATPAIAEDRIYVRTINTLYCFANKSTPKK